MKLNDIKNLSEVFNPDRTGLDCQPNRTFKEKPVYDDAGNVIGYTLPKYSPDTPPLPEDVTESSNFNLKDPNVYASVIIGNQSVNLSEQAPYDAFSATSAVENLVNNLPKSE